MLLSQGNNYITIVADIEVDALFFAEGAAETAFFFVRNEKMKIVTTHFPLHFQYLRSKEYRLQSKSQTNIMGK